MTIDVRDASLRGGNVSCFVERGLPIVLILSLAFLIGLEGTLPHLFFARDLGERIFFEGAYDEAFYSIVMSGEVAAWNEYPIRSLMRLLMFAAGGPNFSFAMWSDVLWPALVVLSAGFLVLSLTRSWVIVIPAAFLLVFGSDILAFNSSAIYPPQLIISNGLRNLPIALRELVPDPFTNFLYVYRTPEPQLSLSFFLCYLAIIVRFLGRQRSTSSDWMIVFCATAICTATYVFFATACLMAAGLAVLSLSAARRWRTAIGLLMVLSTCVLLFGWLATLSHSGEAKATLFHSRLPMIAPSLIYGCLSALLLGWRFRNELTREPRLFFGLLCLLVPAVTLNQQIATGLMVQTLNWERYVNYPFLVLGLFLFLTRLSSQKPRWQLRPLPMLLVDRIHTRLSPKLADYYQRALSFFYQTRKISTCFLFLMLAAVFVYRAQLHSYRQYAYYNLRTVAYAKLLDRIETEQSPTPQNVTLDDPAMDAEVRLRTHTPRLSFNGYTDLVLAWKNTDAASYAAGNGNSLPLKQQWGFVHAARLGFSREAYEAELRKEIELQVCWPHLMFQFSFLECAPYVSDFRLYAPEHLREKIPEIGLKYETFLRSKPRGAGAFVLSMKPIPGLNRNDLPSQSPVATLKLATRPNGFSPETTVEVLAYRSDL